MKTETNTVQHTKGEVKVQEWADNSFDVVLMITEKKYRHICQVTNTENFGEAEANAEHIVRCWNEYDKLKKDNTAMLDKLKAIANYADSVNSASDLYNSPLVEDVKAVIKEVEQK